MTKNKSKNLIWSEDESKIFIKYGNCFIPKREHQLQIICDLLPYENIEKPIYIDLCCGDGSLIKEIAKKKEKANIIGMDLSDEMIQKAKEKNKEYFKRTKFEKFNLENIKWRNELKNKKINGITSSLAIHHLDDHQKQILFNDVFNILEAGGAFIIADLIKPINKYIKDIAAKSWDLETQKRSLRFELDLSAFKVFEKLKWNYFSDPNSENDPIDKPSTILSQLKWLEEAGFKEVDVFWMEAGHAIFGGYKI